MESINSVFESPHTKVLLKDILVKEFGISIPTFYWKMRKDTFTKLEKDITEKVLNIGVEFLSWADNTFKVNEESNVTLLELMQDFNSSYPLLQGYMSFQKFLINLKAWCDYRDYEYMKFLNDGKQFINILRKEDKLNQ